MRVRTMTHIRRRDFWPIRSSVLSVSALLCCIASPSPLSADPIAIVDTGASGAVATSGGDWNMGWLAAEFSTASAWRITSVEGWIVPSGVERFGGPLRINLLSDGGNIPSTPLFSTSTHIPGVGPAGWYGQSGLNWMVQPGSYWVSFEALAHASSGPAFSGATFGMSGTTAAPLANQASALLASECNFRERSCWPWTPNNGLDIGVRIFAEPAAMSPVPEPSTVLFLLTGLPLIWRGRRLLSRPD